jgi:peptidoglycan hydrolase-like protein with peptidoglycan-binding domain
LLGLAGRGTEPDAPGPAAAPAPEPAIDIPTTEMLERQERLDGTHHDALVAFAGPAAAPVQQALARLGFNVDAVDRIEEGARLLEQGVYEVAVTSRSAGPAGKTETLAQRILRMPSEARRRVFVVLVGDEFRSGDGTQAWAAQADLVLNPADASRCENLIRALMVERKRLYQPFVDARNKIEAD